MANVHLPKGTRDLLPAQMTHRLRVIDTIRRVFTRYGFAPLETPAMERIETLMGKYGDEGEKLIFKVLKRGEGGQRGEVDQALRYDLTVPLARVVAMNPDLPMPFKRYQISPVWRADRPQRGRFREFYQCDVDTVGSTSPVADAEALAVVNDVMSELGFTSFTLRLNDRRLLRALAEQMGAADRETEFLVALDKLDKIGRDGVSKELLGRGFHADQVDRMWTLLDGESVPGAEEAEAGLRHVEELARAMGVPAGRIAVDRTLARGLDYYTGPVFEIAVTEPPIGSLGGGGRYDGLIGMFSGRDVPAVGVSIGIERVFVVMEELGMLPAATTETRVLVALFSEEQRAAALRVAAAFRRAGVNTEVSLDVKKLGKQLKAASAQGIPYVAVIGPDEATAGTVQLKDLSSGEQQTLGLAEAVALVAG